MLGPASPSLLGLAVALGGPPALVVVSRTLFGDDPSLAVETILQLIFCGLALFILFVVVRVERMSVASIGLRKPDWSTLGTGLLAAFVCFVLLPLVTAPLVRTFGQAAADAGVAKMAVWPAWFRLFVGATSGFVEETLYRGYAVERLIAMTRSRWLGAVLAAAAFAVAHVPAWGVTFALVADLPAGAVLVLFYLWRRDLLANGLAHSIGLLIALFTAVPPG